MHDLLLSVLTFLFLCAGAATGRGVLRVLPEHHRSVETLEFTRTVSGLLVTFVALVLSLLLTSVNGDFKKADGDLQSFAATVIRLDGELVALGAEAEPVRTLLRRYLAAAIASTWPAEAHPAGPYPAAITDRNDFESPNLGVLLDEAAGRLRRLDPSTEERRQLRADGLARLDTLVDQRWTLINEAHSTISPPFLAIALFWLFGVFVSFGISAPRNATAAAFMLLVGVSVAGVVFVILELDGPLDGLVKVSSEPMRHALRHLDAASPLKGSDVPRPTPD